jgi:hypothetical protein
MNNQEEIAKAFKYFQDAARNRDAEPEIFEGARIRYYALKNGDAWLEQEKKRLQSESLQPVIEEYKRQYESLENEASVQRGFTDSIAAIRDKQSALKSGVSGNLSFFQRYLEDKQTQLSNYNRYVELTTPGYATYTDSISASPIVRYFAGFPASFHTILDVFIGFLILLTLLIILRKLPFFNQSSSYSFNSSPSIT